MIDGSFVEVPRQRNTREENKQIKEGKAVFNTLTDLVYNLCRYEQVMRLGIN